MMRNLFTLSLLTFLVVVHGDVLAQENTCKELLENEADLNKVYDVSKLVFVARIQPRNSINPQIYNFKTYDPVLKGDVPEHGFVTFAQGCKPRAEDSVYLFMLNRLDEEIQGFNAVFLSLPDGGPGYRWVADWIATRIPDKAGSSGTDK